MRARTLTATAFALLLAASAAPAALSGEVEDLPAPLRAPVVAAVSLLGPAYDAAAGTEVRSLGLALFSYSAAGGDLATVTPAELGDWGWTRSGNLDVTVRVDGDRFLVRARDVRPGASTLQVSGDQLGVRAVPREQGIADDVAVAGFRVERGRVG